MIGLLKLGLTYSENKYQFVEQTEVVSRSRIVEQVTSGEISVMWTGGSREMEEVLTPVHIPAYKGLMGHRIFIIRKGDQQRFDNISSMDQLKNIKIGQGRTWADTKILKNSGLHVITTLKTEGLFYMLDGARFDAFPRGIHEPWQEVSRRPQLALTIEKNILIKYIMPYYLYFNPDNSRLIAEVSKGLESAISDGSFDRYFYGNPDVISALAQSNLDARKIFTIPNPNISERTPVDRRELWLDLSKESSEPVASGPCGKWCNQ